MSNQTFIVILRRPGKDDPRTDPFWEFGSFGCTGCHGKNLLHPKNCRIRKGARLAFVQGGHLGFRLLLLTPPVERIDHTGSPRGLVELCWRPARKPFRYDHAPSIFESPVPGKRGLFPKLADSLAHTDRFTMDAKFASRYRARARPLEPELARELEAGFNVALKKAKKSHLITCYEDALPWCDCPSSPSERRRVYQRLLRTLHAPRAGKRSCR